MTEHSALLVVDSQVGALEEGFYGPTRSNPSYEQNVTRLLAGFRATRGTQIIYVVHNSINLSSPLHPLKSTHDICSSHIPLAGEPVITKSTNSAFVTPELANLLKERQIWKIYFVGLSVDHCLGTTVRSASDLRVGDHVDEKGNVVAGDIVLVSDATAAWGKNGGKYDAETVHGVHVESLKGEFARVVDTEQVLREIAYID